MTVAVGYYAGTFHTFTTSSTDLRKIQEFMDKAKTIVIQNHTFDLGVLEKYFPSRPGLVSWHKKVYDFYDVCRSLFGCPFPLESLAEFNKEIPAKLGSSENAPELWNLGKIQELMEYCKRDVEILLGLYNKRKRLRVPVRKDSVTKKIVGVVTINLVTGVVPYNGKRNKKVMSLLECNSAPGKCKVCVEGNKHKYPTFVVFEELNKCSS
jgi:uncharacterized protein YggU (UPF0235/DUF167 family)